MEEKKAISDVIYETQEKVHKLCEEVGMWHVVEALAHYCQTRAKQAESADWSAILQAVEDLLKVVQAAKED